MNLVTCMGSYNLRYPISQRERAEQFSLRYMGEEKWKMIFSCWAREKRALKVTLGKIWHKRSGLLRENSWPLSTYRQEDDGLRDLIHEDQPPTLNSWIIHLRIYKSHTYVHVEIKRNTIVWVIIKYFKSLIIVNYISIYM